MPPKFVRRSMFRHVHGDDAKKECHYQNINITKASWDSPFCAVNPKFLAIVTESSSGGSFLVLPLDQVGRLPQEYPQVVGHESQVMDVAWNPFDDNMIASGSEDTTVKIWEIPDGGLTENLVKPLLSLESHEQKVGHVVWHPTASNILLSASHDKTILIWYLETADPVVTIDCHPDLIFSVSWSNNGSKIVTTCKDKKLRIIDARKGEILSECDGHKGSKPQRAVFCGNTDMIFTTGFSKMSERELGVWSAKSLEQLALEQIDTGSGALYIHYDSDSKMIYLCGKGDCLIRYYELVEKEPYNYWLASYTLKNPQKGVCFMPKRGVDVNSNEVAKAYRLVSPGGRPGVCEPVSFTVPRKSELFQEDIFPDCSSDEPALTADEWIGGKDADPKTMSLKDKFLGKDKPGGSERKAAGLVIKTKAEDLPESPEDDLLAMIKKLQETAAAHEKRIKALEEE